MVTEPRTGTADADADGDADASYARAVGRRLRQVRNRRRLSLQAVERLSSQEFKASVLGAYERGERVISVSRLQRLAVLYDVAVDALLPAAPTPGELRSRTDGGRITGGDGDTDGLDARLEAIAERDPEIVARYLRTIRSRRHGEEGTTIAIRADDIRAMELLLGTSPSSGEG